MLQSLRRVNLGTDESIMKSLPILKQFTTLTLKNGKSISFWEDPWCNNTSLHMEFPKLWKISKRKEAVVADMLQGEGHEVAWNFTFSRELENEEVAPLISMLEKIGNPNKLLDEDDIRCWRGEKNGAFSASSCYQLENDPGRIIIKIKALLYRWGMSNGKFKGIFFDDLVGRWDTKIHNM
ncbi:hypothetical protein BVC80_8917g4 [Macleaya cordata]|uniref:Reverse transcriptase zinc-binding domain n=1 Tax=Macleaya cordata TaxID=56857 RepID=A0A200QRR9_MACCD|nr:hypothetical protein BVC80_8917g4 [Macleaya cordata]